LPTGEVATGVVFLFPFFLFLLFPAINDDAVALPIHLRRDSFSLVIAAVSFESEQTAAERGAVIFNGAETARVATALTFLQVVKSFL